MPAKGASTLRKPIRLPPLRTLRVKDEGGRRVEDAKNPCALMLSSVLNCWASSGHTAQNCVALEQSLRTCMDTKRPPVQQKSSTNYHLSRLYPKIVGPTKKNP